MKKVSYANMKVKIEEEVKTFIFNDTEIEVLQYLPISDKKDLIEVTIQQSISDGIFNVALFEQHYKLNLIYLYSNINFTDKQRENEDKLYDTLRVSGFIAEFMQNMNQDELELLKEYIFDYKEEFVKFSNSAIGAARTIFNNFSQQIQGAVDMLQNFDKDKLQEVVRFVETINKNQLAD